MKKPATSAIMSTGLPLLYRSTFLPSPDLHDDEVGNGLAPAAVQVGGQRARPRRPARPPATRRDAGSVDGDVEDDGRHAGRRHPAAAGHLQDTRAAGGDLARGAPLPVRVSRIRAGHHAAYPAPASPPALPSYPATSAITASPPALL